MVRKWLRELIPDEMRRDALRPKALFVAAALMFAWFELVRWLG